MIKAQRFKSEALEEGKENYNLNHSEISAHFVEEIGMLPSSKFCNYIDEAHSSFSGQMARKLNESLSKLNLDSATKKEIDDDDKWRNSE